MPIRLAGSRSPLTGKPSTGPSQRFHATCNPMAAERRPVRRRAAASRRPATKIPIIPRALALGFPRCSRAKIEEDTSTPQVGESPSDRLRSRKPREISSS